jgi:hypothetical protein
VLYPRTSKNFVEHKASLLWPQEPWSSSWARSIRPYLSNTHFNIIIPLIAYALLVVSFCLTSQPKYYIYSSSVQACYKPPMWSSGRSSWLQSHRHRVRFLVLPDFMRSSGFGTGSNQSREYNWSSAWKIKCQLQSRNPRIRPYGICSAHHAALLYP